MAHPYSTETELIDTGPGSWKTARVKVFEGQGEAKRQIGSYQRNHAGWCETTFAPFVRDGRWFALYSPDYTATRIMELPSCKDIGGEEPHSHGFCPVDYYVPYEYPALLKAGTAGHFGFVAGCIWGDDSSWKIQFLDLTDAPRGVLVRREAFGYVAMPSRTSRLSECISLDEYSKEHPHVEVTARISFDLGKGARVDPFS